METVIKTNELTKRFGDFVAVDKISFEVKKGEIFGFLGANGAGKTTAMRMLCGLSRPSSGEATVAGIYGLSDKDIKEKSNELVEKLGLQEQANKLVQSLPLGWRQKLSFSVAIVH